MFKNNFSFIPPIVEKDKNGKPITVVMNAVESQKFQRGVYGFPMSDITAAVQAQSLQEYDALLRDAQQMQVAQPDYSGYSLEEIAAMRFPRNLQTPTEVARASAIAAGNSERFRMSRTTDDVKPSTDDVKSSSDDVKVDPVAVS